MKLETLKDLYILELKDLYSTEKQIIAALPKMAKAATNAAVTRAVTPMVKSCERRSFIFLR